MQCPKCSGPMWDNRVDKKTPNSPDYKCKNGLCKEALWLAPKGQKEPAVQRIQEPVQVSDHSYTVLSEVVSEYMLCQAEVFAKVVPVWLSKGALMGTISPEAVNAATATIVIQLNRRLGR